MKVLKIALAAGAASVAMSGAALAQESPVSFSVGAATDYVFRGVSQTDESPQIFAGAEVALGEIGYAGAWASNVDFLDSTDAEIDLYAGVTPMAGPITLDLGVIYYGYVNAPSGSDYDYWELKAGGSAPIGPAEVGAAFYYSPDFFGGTGDALYSEINAAYGITDSILVSGAVGHQAIDAGGDYTTWNIGVGYSVTERIAVDLRYHDTDKHEFGDYFESRVVASISAGF